MALTANYVYVAIDVPPKEVNTIQKRYEVFLRHELLGTVSLTQLGDWTWEPSEKGTPGVSSRTAAADRLKKHVHGH